MLWNQLRENKLTYADEKEEKARGSEHDSSYRNPCYTKKIVNVAMYKMVLTLQRKYELLPRPCLESSVSAIGI